MLLLGGLVLVFVMALAIPLVTNGPAFLYTDETYGYLQSRALYVTGDYAWRVPYAETAGLAFRPMGVGWGQNESVKGGPSPLFVHIFSLGAAGGPLGAQAFAVLFAGVLLLSVAWLVRVQHQAGAALLSVAILATSPPLVFWASFFMANLPTVTLFIAHLAALTQFARDRTPAWLAISMVLLVLVVGLRRDAVGLAIPALLLLGVTGFRQPVMWGLAGLVAWSGLAAYRLAVGQAATLSDAVILAPDEIKHALMSLTDRFRTYHDGPLSVGVLSNNMRTYVLAVYPLLAILGGVASLVVRPRTRGGAGIMASFAGVTLLYLLVVMTITPDWGNDPPGVMSSLVRYALLVPVFLAVCVGVFLARAVSGPRASGPVLAAICLMLVVPQVVQAIWDEPGYLWLQEERAWRSDADQAARGLPSDAFIVADELSKSLTARFVLSPFGIRQDRNEAVPRMIDALARQQGVSAFLLYDTYYGDWSGVVGEYVTSANHYTQPSGVGDFLAVKRTNTSLTAIGILQEEHWVQRPDGLIQSGAKFSYFWVTPVLEKNLQQAPSPGLRVTLTVHDTDTAWHQAGFVNAPGGPNNVVITHRWLGTGSGEWRTESFFIPADTVINGPFFVSQDLTFRELKVEPLPGVVEQ